MSRRYGADIDNKPAMQSPFVVKGVTPMGRIVKFVILAGTERQAAERVADLGLISVIIRPGPPEPPAGAGPAALEGTRDGSPPV